MIDPVIGHKSAAHYRELYEEHKARADRAEQERDQLRELMGEIYQVLGCHDASEQVLDVVEAAATGQPFPLGSLLPYHHDEIEELRARVAELEDALLKSITGKPVRNADEVLGRKPEVSLAAIEARVLRGAAEEIKSSCMVIKSRGHAALWLDMKADRIEKEAEPC